jgi:TldD protein
VVALTARGHARGVGLLRRRSTLYSPRLMTSRYQAPFAETGPAPIDPEIARKLLDVALAQGGDYADLFFEYAASGSYAYDEGILKSAGRFVTMGLGVRVMKGDATGYAYVEDLDLDAMKHAARTAGQIAAGGKPIAPQAITRKSPADRYPIGHLSMDVDGVVKRELLERADRAARAADPRITKVDASLSEELREILIVTSTGHFVRDRQPLLRFGVRAIAEENGKRQAGSSGGGGRVGLEYFEKLSPEHHAKEAVRQAVAMLDAREAPAGEMEVVLAPGDSGILLHEAVGHGLEADFNRKGTSNYTAQVGKEVASELCTVVDDATLGGSRGSINVDDEGLEPTSSTLIEKGILRGYMQDRHSADFFHVTPTGNGRRESFRSHPMPRMTNTLLLAGQDDPEEIVRSVKKGVYARKFGGGQVDISNGDFVFSLTEGYLIEDGKITAPLKGVNLIGNGPDVMRKVVMLGHDLEVSDGIWTCGKDGQSVPVGVGCPTIKISAVTVGGTQL